MCVASRNVTFYKKSAVPIKENRLFPKSSTPQCRPVVVATRTMSDFDLCVLLTRVKTLMWGKKKKARQQLVVVFDLQAAGILSGRLY